jgi:hypothetical protein
MVASQGTAVAVVAALLVAGPAVAQAGDYPKTRLMKLLWFRFLRLMRYGLWQRRNRFVPADSLLSQLHRPQ